ncbi:class I SAM-dependent methyltransferase [Candidatus Fermentibacteria bacterium]|nr:class I SAM-dependent methyltransferase [Candidatus Fermentibacteria bacterium]
MTVPVLHDCWEAYSLLDSGHRRKLERFGDSVVVRDEPKAWWSPDLPESTWNAAGARCDAEGRWHLAKDQAREWILGFDGLTLEARVADTSRHVGVFPEQSAHWRWIGQRGRAAAGSQPTMLSLFGYTGVATLYAASLGFAVTHVDASKPALSWARRNQELSGLTDAPIRWILDDALKFVRREHRRGRRYDAIVLDPPSFGRGPSGEVWKVELGLPELLHTCSLLLADDARFVILTLYNLDASSLMIANLMRESLGDRGGRLEAGELALRHAHSSKLLPLALFGRWAQEPCPKSKPTNTPAPSAAG